MRMRVRDNAIDARNMASAIPPFDSAAGMVCQSVRIANGCRSARAHAVLHPTGTLASVYYEYAVRLTSSDTEVSTMLGCAIAHEIGHLLLGPRSHSAGELCAQRAGRRRSAWR
jgi:hypothetical protein